MKHCAELRGKGVVSAHASLGVGCLAVLSMQTIGEPPCTHMSAGVPSSGWLQLMKSCLQQRESFCECTPA